MGRPIFSRHDLLRVDQPGDAVQEQTLETLKKAPFNKIRMCVFPKDYAYNENEPTLPFLYCAG